MRPRSAPPLAQTPSQFPAQKALAVFPVRLSSAMVWMVTMARSSVASAARLRAMIVLSVIELAVST